MLERLKLERLKLRLAAAETREPPDGLRCWWERNLGNRGAESTEVKCVRRPDPAVLPSAYLAEMRMFTKRQVLESSEQLSL